jgi:hypothetical protein
MFTTTYTFDHMYTGNAKFETCYMLILNNPRIVSCGEQKVLETPTRFEDVATLSTQLKVESLESVMSQGSSRDRPAGRAESRGKAGRAAVKETG